ncbi:MAG: ECF transporter S component [Candidatus Korarchaeum sp.]|nr:ECF transporter S component [Candidatus Korarchaeum sp.]
MRAQRSTTLYLASSSFFGGIILKGSVSKLVATTGLMTALTTVATMVIQVPIPATKGYINLGDTMVMLSGSLFGSLVGSVAGGLGSALADLLSGYAHWAPFTLVIKCAEGYIAGLSKDKKGIFKVLILIIAGVEMVLGYFLVEVWLYGLGGALAELPGNSFQAASGTLLAYILTSVIRRVL